MEPAIDRLLTIYATAIAAPPGDGSATRAAATHVCRHIAQPLKHAHELSSRLQTTTRNLDAARRDLDSCAHAGAGHAARAESWNPESKDLTRDVEAARAELEARAAEMREASARVQSYELAAQDQILALQRQVAAYQALPIAPPPRCAAQNASRGSAVAVQCSTAGQTAAAVRLMVARASLMGAQGGRREPPGPFRL